MMRTGRRDAESVVIGLLLLACDAKDARVGSVNPQHPSGGTGGGTGAAAGLAGEHASGGTTTFTGGTSSGGTTGGTSTGGTQDTGGEAGAPTGGAVGVSGGGGGGAQGGSAGTGGNGGGAARNAGADSGSSGTAGCPPSGVDCIGCGGGFVPGVCLNGQWQCPGLGSCGGAGSSGGSAGMPPTTACMPSGSGEVTAVLLDENELRAALPSTAVTVVSVGPSPEGTPYVNSSLTREIRLRDGAANEWSYHLLLPGMPDDIVKAGDALILTSTIVRNFSDGQLIVLGTASELIVFTASAPLDTLPNLDAYGLTLGYGAPTCTSSIFLCTGSESPILITSGNSTQSVQPQETKPVFSLSFTNARTFRHDNTFQCSTLDPPDSFIYGAFRLAN